MNQGFEEFKKECSAQMSNGWTPLGGISVAVVDFSTNSAPPTSDEQRRALILNQSFSK